MTELTSYIIADIGCINMIAPFTIFPYIFNRKLIPSIEKQLDTKLYFGALTGYSLFWGSSFYGKHLEISLYITFKLIARMLGFDESKLKLSPRCALYAVDYKTKQASKSLITWSLLDVLNSVSFFVLGWMLIHYS